MIGAFVQSRLEEEIKRLHNPTSEKTAQLFRDYAGVEVTGKWCWNNYDEKTVRERLNQYMKLRGDVVHRSRSFVTGPTQPDPVTKDDLDKAIRFLKALVSATESAILKSN